MEEKIVTILVEGGTVGIALAIIWYMWRRDLLFNKTLNNHLEHSLQSDKEIAKSNIELAKAITHLSGKIEDCPLKK